MHHLRPLGTKVRDLFGDTCCQRYQTCHNRDDNRGRFSQSVCVSRRSTRNYALIFSCTRAPLLSGSVRSNHERRGSTFCCSFLRERERVHLSPHIPSDPAFARWAPVRLAHGASIARNFKNSRPMQSITEPRAFSPFSLRRSGPSSPRLGPDRFSNRRSRVSRCNREPRPCACRRGPLGPIATIGTRIAATLLENLTNSLTRETSVCTRRDTSRFRVRKLSCRSKAKRSPVVFLNRPGESFFPFDPSDETGRKSARLSARLDLSQRFRGELKRKSTPSLNSGTEATVVRAEPIDIVGPLGTMLVNSVNFRDVMCSSRYLTAYLPARQRAF